VPDEGTPKRVIISVPKPEVVSDDGVWDDLEVYLFTGFLTSSAVFENIHFVFKTLNHTELRGLEYFRPVGASSSKLRTIFKNTFIAHSLFMLNGQNVLFDRTRNMRKMLSLIEKLPQQVTDKILEELNALNNRATRLHPLTEVYAWESRARYKWLHTKDAPINSSTSTGIVGTSEIGMNYCQQTFVALSRIIDSRDEFENAWSNAKFIGGCFAGKGIRSIEDKDKARLARDEELRAEKKRDALKAYLNRTILSPTKTPELISLPDGRLAEVVSRQQANTVEELAEQLSRALSNEKDAHDLAVEAEIRRAREHMALVEQQKRELAAQNVPIPKMQLGSRILSAKEVEDMKERLKPLEAKPIEEPVADLDFDK
jgi:hypothetical protein